MSQLRLNQLPDGSGSLSNDDIFIFMDDPSGAGVTKKISLNQISNAIGGGGGGNASTGDISFSGVSIIGSGTGSGDGGNKGTIELVPDATLKNNDQYLVVDPTGPDHIHLRAGGTQDNSAAELIIGGEYAHVNITDYNHQVNIRTDGGEIDTTINLGLPSAPYGDNAFATEFIPPYGSTITVGDTTYTISGSWDLTHAGEDKGINLSPSTPILEYGNYPIHLASIPKSWTFQNDGNLSIPGNIQLSNGTSLAKGTYDNATSGNNGISLNCAVGYELNWQGGHLKSTSNNGTIPETLNIDSNINITTITGANLRICHGNNGNETFISSSGTILNGLLIIKNMPTSDPISSGAVWNSGGILAISNG